MRFSENPERYLMHASTNSAPFILKMAGEGWALKDQVGGGLVFQQKDGQISLATQRNWTKRYMVIVSQK